jgi:hypothetical protein
MVDLIPLRRLYKYESFLREEGGETGRHYVDSAGKRLPSVTTILSATKDRRKLDEWADRVEKETADRIRNDAASVGTHMHNVVERMIAYRDLPKPTNWNMVLGYEMGYRLIRERLVNMNEIWASEATLHYPEKYAGTADLIGIYRGNQAIIDLKQSLKPKRHEWIEDYFHQTAAYALAHDIVHGTSITHAYVLIALQTGGTQELSTAGREFERYKEDWMKRVERYHSLDRDQMAQYFS